jgi:hypothetical protein
MVKFKRAVSGKADVRFTTEVEIADAEILDAAIRLINKKTLNDRVIIRRLYRKLLNRLIEIDEHVIDAEYKYISGKWVSYWDTYKSASARRKHLEKLSAEQQSTDEVV